jgi:hypothetical protein
MTPARTPRPLSHAIALPLAAALLILMALSIAPRAGAQALYGSIESVSVVTSSLDADQGLAGGAAINLQMKSGTNQLRGSLFTFHGDEALNSILWRSRLPPRPASAPPASIRCADPAS